MVEVIVSSTTTEGTHNEYAGFSRASDEVGTYNMVVVGSNVNVAVGRYTKSSGVGVGVGGGLGQGPLIPPGQSCTQRPSWSHQVKPSNELHE